MKLFANKDIHRFFGEVSAVLILFLLAGIIFSQAIVHDFKAQLLTHDYELEGYLLEQGANPADVSAVFGAEKTEQERSSGKRLLQTLSYKEDINNRLLPEGNRLLSRYRPIIAMPVVLFGTLILTFVTVRRRWFTAIATVFIESSFQFSNPVAKFKVLSFQVDDFVIEAIYFICKSSHLICKVIV